MREDEKHRHSNNICCRIEGTPWAVCLTRCKCALFVELKDSIERHLPEGVQLQTFKKNKKVKVVSYDLAWSESILQGEVRGLSWRLSLKEYLQSL